MLDETRAKVKRIGDLFEAIQNEVSKARKAAESADFDTQLAGKEMLFEFHTILVDQHASLLRGMSAIEQFSAGAGRNGWSPAVQETLRVLLEEAIQLSTQFMELSRSIKNNEKEQNDG